MDCANKIQMCRAKMMPCDFVGNECECPLHCAGCRQEGNVPDLATIEALYREMCGGVLSDHHISCIRELHKMMEAMNLDGSSSCEAITYDSVDEYLKTQNVREVTKRGKCEKLHTIFGKKARVFYRRRGYDVRDVDTPLVDSDEKAYRTMPREMLFKVMTWYRSLQFRPDRRGRIYAMLMGRYAMRNGDVERLRWSNFEKLPEGWRLRYIPHKTEKATAGRSVTIWLDMMDQIELMEWMGSAKEDDLVIPQERYRRGKSVETLARNLNAELRDIGLTGGKGLYELRKLCIDTVFHLYGAEAASAYSGDDYGTVKFHYADPSSLNLRGINDSSFAALYNGRMAS